MKLEIEFEGAFHLLLDPFFKLFFVEGCIVLLDVEAIVLGESAFVLFGLFGVPDGSGIEIDIFLLFGLDG